MWVFVWAFHKPVSLKRVCYLIISGYYQYFKFKKNLSQINTANECYISLKYNFAWVLHKTKISYNYNLSQMGSCWGTSPFSAYAAHLAEVHNINYMAPPVAMATSNVAVVGVPNPAFQMSQSINPVAQMAPLGAPQPMYMSRPATPIMQYW